MSDPNQVLSDRIAAMASLPVSQQRLVLRGLQQVYETDPVLQGIPGGTAVRAWEGDVREQDVPQEDELPLLRLTPRIGPSRWKFENAHFLTIPTAVEMYSPGVDAANLLDLADAAFVALFPDDPARKVEVKDAFGAAAGAIQRFEWVQGYGSPEKVGATPYALKTVLLVNAYMYRDSPWWGDPGPP